MNPQQLLLETAIVEQPYNIIVHIICIYTEFLYCTVIFHDIIIAKGIIHTNQIIFARVWHILKLPTFNDYHPQECLPQNLCQHHQSDFRIANLKARAA